MGKTASATFLEIAQEGDFKIITDDMEFSAYLKDALRHYVRGLEQRLESKI